ncbi:SLC37A3 [Mytilus edulis]|uniref:SLC37A3 n=1 Tax=Mytilus edulis TaxID=6550 RepID=A0A8S3R6A3_MYTED|nr:SLC37A3 [Mytilus edulis]
MHVIRYLFSFQEEENTKLLSTKSNYLKWMSLLAGGLAHAMLASNLIFYVYINDIKARFRYDQKEVEAFASMLNAGIGLGFVPNLIGQKLKSAWVLAFGMVLSTIGILMLWSSTKMVSFYEDKSWLMALYFLISGLGGSVGYIMALRFNADHFADDKRGRVIAVMFVFIDSGMISFTLIYYHAFPPETRFERLLIILVSFNAVVYIFCMIFLRPPSSNIPSVDESELQTSGFKYETLQEERQILKETSFRDLLVNADYHLLAWMCSLTFAVSLLLSNNMTVLTKEEELSSFDNVTTLLYPPIVIVSALSFSAVSDKIKNVVSRITFLIIGGLFLALSSLLNAFLSSHKAVIATALVLAAIGTGMVYTIGPTTMSEQFHIDNFMRNWGIVMFMRAILIIILHVIFGAFYDIEIKDTDGLFCKGLHCTRNGYILTCVVSFIAIGLGVCLNFRVNKRRSQT